MIIIKVKNELTSSICQLLFMVLLAVIPFVLIKLFCPKIILVGWFFLVIFSLGSILFLYDFIMEANTVNLIYVKNGTLCIEKKKKDKVEYAEYIPLKDIAEIIKIHENATSSRQMAYIEIQLKMKNGQTQLIPEFFKLEYNSDKIIEGIMGANNSIELTITENRDFKLL
jgi:hypothetical protein